MIGPLPPPLFLGGGGRVLSALIHLDLRFFARISMEVTNPEHDKHSPRESIKLDMEQYGPVGRTTVNTKKGVFHSWGGGGVGELKPKAARVQWEVWTGTQERWLVRWQGCQTCHCSPWCHCPHWEPPPFPGGGGVRGDQSGKEGLGADFVWLHLRGSDLSSGEDAQRGALVVAVTEAAAEVAPGAITGPGRRPPELQP